MKREAGEASQLGVLYRNTLSFLSDIFAFSSLKNVSNAVPVLLLPFAFVSVPMSYENSKAVLNN